MCFICMVCLQEIRACEYKENEYMNLLFCVSKYSYSVHFMAVLFLCSCFQDFSEGKLSVLK